MIRFIFPLKSNKELLNFGKQSARKDNWNLEFNKGQYVTKSNDLYFCGVRKLYFSCSKKCIYTKLSVDLEKKNVSFQAKWAMVSNRSTEIIALDLNG